MKRPSCIRHRDLVLELALGLLEDEAAFEAEEILVECPECAEWWRETFAGPALETVDDCVAEVFAETVLPARRRHHPWFAAAAALVVMLAGTSLWRVAEKAPGGEQLVTIESLDFESGNLTLVGAAADSRRENPRAEESVREDENDRAEVFSQGMEDGTIEGWSTTS